MKYLSKDEASKWAAEAPLKEVKHILAAIQKQYVIRYTSEYEVDDKQYTNVTVRTELAEDAEKIDERTVQYQLSVMVSKSLKYKFSLMYMVSKREFLAEHMKDVCYICDRAVFKVEGNRQRTIDHFVPAWLCKEVDYYKYLLDHENFRVCCKECNTERGFMLLTVGAIRDEIGNQPVDKLFNRANQYRSRGFSIKDFIS